MHALVTRLSFPVWKPPGTLRLVLGGRRWKSVQLPPRLVVDEGSITESFLKGSGPGGQKINKTSSAVQLQHGPTGIVVKCQETRSRSQNRKIARRLLAERIDELQNGQESRGALKADMARKKKASAAKKKNRKYRQLAANANASSQPAA